MTLYCLFFFCKMDNDLFYYCRENYYVLTDMRSQDNGSVITSNYVSYCSVEIRLEAIGFGKPTTMEENKQKIIILIKRTHVYYRLILTGLSEIYDVLKSKTYRELRDDCRLKPFREQIDASMQKMWAIKILPKLRKWKSDYRFKLSQTKGKRTMHCIFGIHDLNDIILSYIFL